MFKGTAKVFDGEQELLKALDSQAGMFENFDMIVVDEASAYKNSQTNRWKTLKSIADNVEWLWMLTGTPAAQSPVDAFGLAKLVAPDNVPRYFGQFRDKVMYKATQYIWRPKADADQTVHKALQPAIRFEKDQCLDLPSVTYVEREAPLTKQQAQYYEILKKQMMLEADGEQVTSVNAATQLNKLLQISGGAVYTDEKEVLEFDVSNRLKIILEVIQVLPKLVHQPWSKELFQDHHQ